MWSTRAAMALVVLTVASAGITANLSRLRTRAAWIMVGGTVALSWLFVQTPLLAGFLHLRPLHSDDWLFAIARRVNCLPAVRHYLGARAIDQ